MTCKINWGSFLSTKIRSSKVSSVSSWSIRSSSDLMAARTLVKRLEEDIRDLDVVYFNWKRKNDRFLLCKILTCTHAHRLTHTHTDPVDRIWSAWHRLVCLEKERRGRGERERERESLWRLLRQVPSQLEQNFQSPSHFEQHEETPMMSADIEMMMKVFIW